MTLESKLQALVAHWKTESKRIKEMADKERSKASKDSLMAQSVRYWMCADELVEALLAERQEPSQSASEGLVQRITDCLAKGGLFNMEVMEAGKVRDLLIDCRAALEAVIRYLVDGLPR